MIVVILQKKSSSKNISQKINFLKNIRVCSMNKRNSVPIFSVLLLLLSTVHACWHGASLDLFCPIFFFFPGCCFLVPSKTLLSATWVINSKAQAVSRLPFSRKTQVQSQVGLCAIYDGQSGMRRVYLWVRWFSPVSITSPSLLHRSYIILLIDGVVKYGTPSWRKERRKIGFISRPSPVFQSRDATNRKIHNLSHNWRLLEEG